MKLANQCINLAGVLTFTSQSTDYIQNTVSFITLTSFEMRSAIKI